MSVTRRTWHDMPDEESDRIEAALLAAMDEDDAMTALVVMRDYAVPASAWQGAVTALEAIRDELRPAIEEARYEPSEYEAWLKKLYAIAGSGRPHG
jgi:hypothetical protein